jgi:hypothetical protein
MSLLQLWRTCCGRPATRRRRTGRPLSRCASLGTGSALLRSAPPPGAWLTCSANVGSQARIQMMEQLGRAEDEMLEKDHELLKVKEDREKHFRQILDQQERLAREILLRKEERISLSLKQQELSGLLKQREALVESLMKRQQELQMRLSRMGDMERELENTRSKLTSTEEAREAMSKRCEAMGERSRSLESALETAKEETRRNAELAQTAEDKLASALAASPIASPAAAVAGGWSGVLNNDTAGGAAKGTDDRGAAGRGNGVGGQGPVGPHTPHRGVPHMPASSALGSATPPESPSTEEVIEYAKFLGMNIQDDRDKELLWIAKEAMAAALPAGWTQHEDKDGFVFFYNAATEQSTYEHPMDDFYRKVYQRAKTTTERDPATLKMHTSANSSPGSSSTSPSGGNGAGFFRRSPGSSGSSMPAGILKQPKAPSPSSGSNQYNAMERMRALEAENALLRQQQQQPQEHARSAQGVTLQMDSAVPASTAGVETPLAKAHSIDCAPTQTKQQESPPANEEAMVEEAPLGGLTEEEIAKIPNPYGLSREALVKKFLFDQQRAHKNSTARARKSSFTATSSIAAAGAGGGLSVRVPALAAGGVSIPVPTNVDSNGAGDPGTASSGDGRMVGQTSATPRPSDKAVEIMDQQGIMQIPQGKSVPLLTLRYYIAPRSLITALLLFFS